MQAQRIKSIKKLGVQKTLDFEVDHPDHNFYAEGIVTSNSHSLSTAYLTALTCYLKFKYPLQFYKACLNGAKEKADFVDRISQIYNELKVSKIPLLPPHLLLSDLDFSIKDSSILFGLQHIKGISDKTIKKLAAFKSEYKTKFDVFLAANQLKIDRRIMNALIFSGSMDDQIGKGNRFRIYLEYILWNFLKDKEKQYAVDLAEKNNYDLMEIVKKLNSEVKNEKGKPAIKDSRLETLRKYFKPYREQYEQNKSKEELLKYLFEIELLGFSFSTSLYDIYKDKIKELVKIEEFKDLPKEKEIRVIGLVNEVKKAKSKTKGTPYIKFLLDDSSGVLKCMAFSNSYSECCYPDAEKIKEGDLTCCFGTKKDDETMFVRRLGIQNLDFMKKIKNNEENKACQSGINVEQ